MDSWIQVRSKNPFGFLDTSAIQGRELVLNPQRGVGRVANVLLPFTQTALWLRAKRRTVKTPPRNEKTPKYTPTGGIPCPPMTRKSAAS